MSENIFVLTPDDSLAEALNKMEIDDSELLPVVNSTAEMVYLGAVSREQIIKRYRKENLFLTDNQE